MKSAIDKLNELKESIREANMESFVEAWEHWVVMLESVVEDLEKVSGLMENQASRIDELENQIEELKDEDDWEEDPTIEVEVNGLPDQMKLEHIQEVFSRYTLEELESLIPRK